MASSRSPLLIEGDLHGLMREDAGKEYSPKLP